MPNPNVTSPDFLRHPVCMYVRMYVCMYFAVHGTGLRLCGYTRMGGLTVYPYKPDHYTRVGYDSSSKISVPADL